MECIPSRPPWLLIVIPPGSHEHVVLSPGVWFGGTGMAPPKFEDESTEEPPDKDDASAMGEARVARFRGAPKTKRLLL